MGEIFKKLCYNFLRGGDTNRRVRSGDDSNHRVDDMGERMNFHRNSQKRIYLPGGVYFITTNTYERHPYFENDVLCELLVETLDFTSLLKGFNLHGLAINPDHLHLLIEPTGKYSYSEIMGTLKRNFSRNCNALISGQRFLRYGTEGAHVRKHIDIRSNIYFQAHLKRLVELQTEYLIKCACARSQNPIPFKWQSSFRDHLIKDEQDYRNHLGYIMKQPLKHGLPGRKWYWIFQEDGGEAGG